MKSFVIISRPDERSSELSKKIESHLENQGYHKEDKSPDLCVVVGGDGTFLRAVQQYIHNLETTAFLGIHTGTLGFFTSYCAEEVDQFIKDIQEKEMKVQEVDLLEVRLAGEEKIFYALNEIRVENSSRTQCMDIFLDQKKLETYHGTGLCIATQLGSTAYNRSVHGAIIYEGLSVLQLSEIAGIHHREYHSLGSPLVIPGAIEVKVTSDNFDGALLCTDSECISLSGEKQIYCKISDRKVKMAQYSENTYLERLQGLLV